VHQYCFATFVDCTFEAFVILPNTQLPSKTILIKTGPLWMIFMVLKSEILWYRSKVPEFINLAVVAVRRFLPIKSPTRCCIVMGRCYRVGRVPVLINIL